MRIIALFGRCGVLAFGIGASAALAAPMPHPARADRLVDERDGFRVEYSPGQEAYAEAMFGALEEYAVKEVQLAVVPAVVQPGSWADLKAHRDEILQQVAAEIGLPAPTEHQGRIFDAMLDIYEFHLRQVELNKAVEVISSCPTQIEIWSFEDLTRRLRSGERLEGYSYDAEKDAISHTITVPSTPLVVGDRQTERMRLVQSGQDISFSYCDEADGVVYLTYCGKLTEENRWQINATGFTPRAPRPAPLKPAVWSDHWARELVEARRRFAETFRVAFPVYVDAKTPAEVANELVVPAWTEVSRILARPDEVDAVVVHTILHEVVDAGIVENTIVSSDRRWLCEGMAEYVAWKILRDRYGVDFARRGKDLDAKLTEYAALQPKIDLWRWRAPEHVSNRERESALNEAHYAFAMRAVAEMVRLDGEAVVPKLFREVAKTPRAKVRMRTVEKAYRKLTGKKLREVLRFAETAPIPVVAK